MADLDPVQLRTFVAVAGQLGFSPAARRLGLSQSAVSRHVRALESAVGRPLLDRDTHTVRLTAAGEIFLGYARRILDLSDEAVEVLGEAGPRGRVRFGVSEDFALTRLPDFLRRFTADYPDIDLEFTVELSVVLHRLLRTGELDAVLAMRIDDTSGGDAFASWSLFRDRQVWIGEPGFTLRPDEPVPLVLYPRPSLTRDAALDALVAAGRAHRTVASSGSLSGLRAAALGGLGLMPFAGSLIPDGLVELDTDLPQLPPITFVLMTRGSHVPAATRVLIEALQADHGEVGATQL
ncbi:LysR family transcriptional regulator [Gordonia phthalatica]|uniref:LysR family transcriptional regulator n=1 Tax=Gordonia phthalatica TaxID=1136941 RepID=A0A0N9N8I6_9ACTN|nr:LysR family transcriptional regulator [Gordonia phthalatica]ALG83408.1 LysR family transcriptional regulator [Gordonia phthalatica]